MAARRADHRRRPNHHGHCAGQYGHGKQPALCRRRRPRRRQRPQPRLPARHGRTCGAARPRGRQLLDLARGDVPLSRQHDPRRHRGRRSLGLRGDAGSGLHRQSASSTICTTPPTVRTTPIRRRLAARIVAAAADERHRPRPAAVLLRPRRLRRTAAHARAGALPVRSRRLLRGSWSRAAGMLPPSRRHPRHRPAFAARRRCAGAARAHRAMERRPDPHPCRRAGARGGRLRGLVRSAARYNGCWTIWASTRAGA